MIQGVDHEVINIPYSWFTPVLHDLCDQQVLVGVDSSTILAIGFSVTRLGRSPLRSDVSS